MPAKSDNTLPQFSVADTVMGVLLKLISIRLHISNCGLQICDVSVEHLFPRIMSREAQPRRSIDAVLRIYYLGCRVAEFELKWECNEEERLDDSLNQNECMHENVVVSLVLCEDSYSDRLEDLCDWCFYECQSLSRIAFGESSVRRIDIRALVKSRLKEIYISEIVEELGGKWFYWCKMLPRVTFGEHSSMKRIGDRHIARYCGIKNHFKNCMIKSLILDGSGCRLGISCIPTPLLEHFPLRLSNAHWALPKSQRKF